MEVELNAVQQQDGESQIAALGRGLCVAYGEQGWDQEPALAAILGGEHGEDSLMQLPLPDFVWKMAPTLSVALEMLALTYVPTIPVEALADIRGFAFLCEGWTFPLQHKHTCSHNDDCPYHQYVRDGGQIADHLDGVEQRSVTMVTIDDRIVFINQHRGSSPRLVCETTRTSTRDSDGGQLGGHIPLALWKVIDATRKAQAA